MDSFKELTAFSLVARKGSLSAAARCEGVTPAIISRRLDALEERLGVRLLTRSTRALTLTYEGETFLEDCLRILDDLANAEAAVAQGGVRVRGHLKLTAPAAFGRRHVAPLLMDFLRDHPDVSASLELTDRLIDLMGEGIDCAIRIGELVDSSMVASRLGEVRRVVVASPSYLQRCGVPAEPGEIAEHRCLALATQSGWSFRDPGRPEHTLVVKVRGPLVCNDGAVLHAGALGGMGLAWRSRWEVAADLRAGRLVAVLEQWTAPPVGIHAIYPQRKHLPPRLRLFIDLMKATYARGDYWDEI
ncbi:MAG: LysR family transcriptional regulator [Gammaproteobacteria bacterium]|nr:LysR family transcriptional regulator [Gammaproteobacteria bacterium]MBI5618149.1 LysR family transcriptional regulator [Gammaproteobacteria bacterium]